MPGVLVRALLLRGAALWLFARLIAIAVFSMAGLPSGGAVLPVWSLAVSATLVHVDLHRRKELMLLGNLGVASSYAVLIGTIPAFVFEGVRAVLPI